jgi:fibronectin-binding autotransporter adhesin
METYTTSKHPSAMKSIPSLYIISRQLLAFLPALLFLAAHDSSFAQSTWTGNSSLTWNTAANWSPSGVPANGANVTVNNSSTGFVLGLNISPTLTNWSSNITSSTPTVISASGANRTLSINGTLTKTGTGTLIFRDNSASIGLSMTVGVIDFTAANAGTLTFGNLPGTNEMTSLYVTTANVSSASGVNQMAFLGKNNTADLTIGTLNMSTNGTVLVANGGTAGGQYALNVGSLNGTGGIVRAAASGNLTHVGTLNLTGITDGTYSGTLVDGGAVLKVTKSGTATQTLGGVNTYTGATTINAGTLKFAKQVSLYNNVTANWTASNIIVNTGAALALNVGGTGEFTSANINTIAALGGASTGFMNNSTLALDTTNAAGGNFTHSGIISNTNGGSNVLNLTKLGTGTLTLSGNNTYTGATAISAGTLSINAAAALGSTSGANLANGTVLLYTGAAGNLTRAISVTSGTGTIQNSGSGLLTLSGGLSKNGTTLTLKGGSNGITVSSAITGSDANSDLILNGGSTTLAAANSYNGPTFLVNGTTLTASVAGALPTGTRTAVSMDATGSGSSTLALGASQSIASLTGAASSNVTLGANTLTIGTTSGSTTFAGRISGSGNLVKDGTSTQVLSGNNAYTGTTTVSSGTLQAAATGALGNSTVINVNGGSFLVTAENAVNNNADINLGGGRMAVSGTFDETVGALTLSANSIIDFSGFVGTLRFSGISSWTSGATLAIWNWSGTTQYGTQINNYATPSNLVFDNTTNLASNLANISFYSDSGSSFVGNGFSQGFSGSGGGTEIIAVPEAETYFCALALLAGVFAQYLRCRANRKSLEGQPQA